MIPAMQAMRLLALGGVTMAAGAMIALSFAVWPPLSFMPPDITSQRDQIIETVGAAITDSFERRWQAAADSPLIPVPPRDPLRGLIGGVLPLALDATQQVEPLDLYADSVPYGLVP